MKVPSQQYSKWARGEDKEQINGIDLINKVPEEFLTEIHNMIKDEILIKCFMLEKNKNKRRPNSYGLDWYPENFYGKTRSKRQQQQRNICMTNNPIPEKSKKKQEHISKWAKESEDWRGIQMHVGEDYVKVEGHQIDNKGMNCQGHGLSDLSIWLCNRVIRKAEEN